MVDDPCTLNSDGAQQPPPQTPPAAAAAGRGMRPHTANRGGDGRYTGVESRRECREAAGYA